MASPLDYTNLPSPRTSTSSDEGLSATLVNEKVHSLQRECNWTLKRIAVIALGGALFLVVIGTLAYGFVGVFVWFDLIPTTKTYTEFRGYESTIDEAEAKGCIFDNLSLA